MRHGFLQTIVLSIAVLLTCSPEARCFQQGPRDLRELSSEQLAALVGAVDPVKNIDPNDPQSHLSKILIPRPGVLL